jgi:hypothetical protein
LFKHPFSTLLTVSILGFPTNSLAAVLSYSLEARTPTPTPLVVPPSQRWSVFLPIWHNL